MNSSVRPAPIEASTSAAAPFVKRASTLRSAVAVVGPSSEILKNFASASSGASFENGAKIG